MAGRYRYGGGRGRSYRGREAALQHMADARAFSDEIGGSDKDVKEYFFSLSETDLHDILSVYGRKFGESAESYARQTHARWKSGATHMSGMVAQRLFSLLPPRMPLAKKFELAENIWKHFGPKSSHTFSAGPLAKVDDVANVVWEQLEKTVTWYGIPDSVKRRFEWLSGNDVALKEQLLNHFRQMEKTLAIQKVTAEVPLLQKQVINHGGTTYFARSTMQVHKHEVHVHIVKHLEDRIVDGVVAIPKTMADYASTAFWILCAIGIFCLIFLR